jgi:hydrogenase maturation protein HypF
MKDDGVPTAADVLLRVRGTVQGVGFRPFVRRAASRLGLRGWVLNDEQGVLIRACGPEVAVAELRRAMETGAPPASRIEAIEAGAPGPDATPVADGFVIAPSGTAGLAVQAAVPPDLALCADCRRELLDPADRRHRYPFINCTQCGPRYSILERLPYDRPRTTMRAFTMCPQCRREYDDPDDRRYHAQPNACPACGPAARLTLGSGGEIRGEPALERAAGILASGGILAVKGIGGYHLMTDATSPAAVAELRRRKHREEKPLAVMFPDLAAVRACAEVTSAAEALLVSAAAPIVLLPRLAGAPLAAELAPGNPWIGALLPYAPLQLLLMRAFGRPAVATSANLSEEPLCFTDPDAHRRLAGIADAFLEHDRRIAHPVDDSVVRLAAAGPVRLRRARGYAPSTLALPGSLGGSWLCAGAQMKSTVGVAAGTRVVLSPHIGDLDGSSTREVYRRTAEMLAEVQQTEFTAVVCDKHPDYASTRHAQATGLPCVAVQHHLAHVLACLLENRHAADDVLGVSWDGTGYGEDGTIWGGEFIRISRGEASRFGRLRPFRLPGAEAAIHDGRRTALALAHEAGGTGFDELADELGLGSLAGNLRRMLENGINSPVTSSAGRLFDAAGALIGLGGLNRFEGQTPLAVEAAAAGSTARIDFPAALRDVAPGGGASVELDWQPILEGIRRGRSRGFGPGDLAAGFHRSLAGGIAAVAARAGAGTVALTGGCFQNAMLLDLSCAALRKAGFNVIVHRELPPNDGNIAAGQALAALWNITSVRLP